MAAEQSMTRKNSKQRRAERRTYLQWDRSQETVTVDTEYGRADEGKSSELAHETAPRRRTFLCPVEFRLTEAEKACIAVRNTFLDVGEPKKEELHRRRSAPVIFGLADKTSLSSFLQQSSEKADQDLDTMSVCTTDTWDLLSGSDDMSDMMPWRSSCQSFASDLSEKAPEDLLKQRTLSTMPDLPTEDIACMVVRNTFLMIDKPKDNGSQ